MGSKNDRSSSFQAACSFFPNFLFRGAKVRRNYLRPVAFRPHLTMGLALAKIGNDFECLPSGRSPREAKVNELGIGPLHNFLENGWSELSWVGRVVNDTE